MGSGYDSLAASDGLNIDVARIICAFSGDEHLLRRTLRYEFGFLVGHFWLLSEVFASCCFILSLHLTLARK